jgi:MraZ protein
MGVSSQQAFMSTPAGTLDRKGRVCIPSGYRQTLATQGSDGVFVRPHPSRPALQCFGAALFDKYAQSKPPQNPFAPEHDDEAFDIYAMTELLAFDENGRVRLPDSLIAHADLGENVAFVGLGDKFEIWDTSRLEAFREERRVNAARAKQAGAT